MYFNKQAVANYAVHYMLNLLGQAPPLPGPTPTSARSLMSEAPSPLVRQDELIRKHIEQRTSFSTGEEVMSWKDAVSVPQRGS